MQKQVFEAHSLWDYREYVGTALDEAPHYFGQAILIGHPQAQLARFVRDNRNTADGTQPREGCGIQIGGIGALAPTRKQDLARLGFRALIAGTLANYLAAAIAGLLLT